MPDIRELLNSMDEESRKLWAQHRTEMKRSYMTAQQATVGVFNWSREDDAFLDLIDIKLANLFYEAGMLNELKTIATAEDGKKTEQTILELEDKIKALKQGKAVTGTNLVDQASGWNGK